MNRELNASDAFLASWLPGGEGSGIADVLYGKRDTTGVMSFSWPASCVGNPLNGPDGALFQVGYTRSLKETASLGELDETCGFLDGPAAADWFINGRLAAGIAAIAGGVELPNLRGEAGGVVARGIDKDRQEDARELTFGPDVALSLQGAGTGAWRITYSMGVAPGGTVALSTGGEMFDASRELTLAAGKGWREMILTESCLGTSNGNLTIQTDAPMQVSISQVSRQELPEGTTCSF